MTAARDPDRLIEAFLDEGPAVMPDRVLEAVRDDIHEQRQRIVIGPWRFFAMPRAYFAAAAVAVVIVVGAVTGLLLVQSGDSNVGDESPSPSRGVTSMPLGVLETGARYEQIRFSELMTFTVPSGAGEMPFEAQDRPFIADVWDAHSFRLQVDGGGSITFHDDVRLQDDVCHPAGVIADVPAGPQAVGEWLGSGEDVGVEGPMELTVDGRTALVFEVYLPDCETTDAESSLGSPAITFAAFDLHRVYAVPTGDDTILIVTWTTGMSQERRDAFNSATDELVESITFK